MLRLRLNSISEPVLGEKWIKLCIIPSRHCPLQGVCLITTSRVSRFIQNSHFRQRAELAHCITPTEMSRGSPHKSLLAGWEVNMNSFRRAPPWNVSKGNKSEREKSLVCHEIPSPEKNRRNPENQVKSQQRELKEFYLLNELKKKRFLPSLCGQVPVERFNGFIKGKRLMLS